MLAGVVVSFPLGKVKILGTTQQSDSFMLSPLLGKVFCVWSWVGNGQLCQPGQKPVREGPQTKIALRLSKEGGMSLASLYSSSGVREGAMPHQSWGRLSYRPSETSPISSSREPSNAGLERKVVLELQVQEAGTGCWENLEPTC